MNILFFGCGKMGSILARNLLANKIVKPTQINIIEKSKNNKISGLKYFFDSKDLPKSYKADLVFLCIKPQESELALEELSKSPACHKNTIFISILAGKKIAFFEKILGNKAKIIRSMPNLPIEDSQGIFFYQANKNISSLELSKLQKLFSSFGYASRLENEALFDAATAIFSSGPAYIFLLQEILSEIALENKIKKEEIVNLVKILFLGSSLMSCNSSLNFSELQESVTSKAGVTAAATKVLKEKSNLKKLFTKAIKAGKSRSYDLSKE